MNTQFSEMMEQNRNAIDREPLYNEELYAALTAYLEEDGATLHKSDMFGVIQYGVKCMDNSFAVILDVGCDSVSMMTDLAEEETPKAEEITDTIKQINDFNFRHGTSGPGFFSCNPKDGTIRFSNYLDASHSIPTAEELKEFLNSSLLRFSLFLRLLRSDTPKMPLFDPALLMRLHKMESEESEETAATSSKGKVSEPEKAPFPLYPFLHE